MIYLDNNATTRVAPDVLDAMMPFLADGYGNPSSAHAIGRPAKAAVDNARGSVVALLGAANEDEIVFTSCGTESDNWAILGSLGGEVAGKHVVTTVVEHDAVRKVCSGLEQRGCEVTYLGVDGEGTLDLDELREALMPETQIVSIMLANNETGVLFPVKEAAEIVKEHSDALFHVDGVNAVGKVPIDLSDTEIDLFSLSADKFYGPKGIGALYIRRGVELPSAMIGGGQERGRRAGTEAVHQIVGLGAAASLVSDSSKMDGIRSMRNALETGILHSIPDTRLNGTSDPAKRLPNTSNISFAHTNGEMIMALLDEAGICVSTGSACHSQGHEASGVLQAMDVPYAFAMGSIRFSFGRFNERSDVNAVLEHLPGIISKLREIGGSYETATI